MMADKKLLNDVVIMRVFVIFLLVILHSFTIYGGDWQPPVGFKEIRPYFWIAKLSYSSMLETFVFISGYLLAYQASQGRLMNNFWIFTKKKALRLLLPCLFFSLLYFLIFSKYDFGSVKSFLFNGSIGHTWFLPMLFWCYIAGYMIEKRSLSILLIVSTALVSLSFLSLPFHLGKALYYLFFFILGIVIFNNRKKIINGFANVKYIILLGLLFAAVFIVGTLLKESLKFIHTNNILEKVIIFETGIYAQLIYATTGLLLSFLIINYFTEKKKIIISKWVLKLSSYSFGIYIFQQFILQALYYKTTLPSLAGAYWLPWIGFIITMILSIILTKYSLKTKFGKFLIG